jgi:DNA polymerase I
MLVQSRKNFEFARSVLLDAEVISFDTETTGLEPYRGDRICGLSVWCHPTGMDMQFGAYFPFRHSRGDSLFDQSENIPIEWLNELRSSLEDKERTFLAHNAKFDIEMLQQEGINIQGKVYCTLIMSYMVDENNPHKLEYLVDKYFGLDTKTLALAVRNKAKRKGGWDKIPPKEIYDYAINDVKGAWKLFPILKEKLIEEKMWHLWEDEEDFMRLLMGMEEYGVLVELDYAKKRAEETRARMRVVEGEIGFDPNERNLAKKLFIELGFAPQRLTLDTTKEFPHGVPSVDRETLQTIEHPIARLAIEYRTLVKANSTWFEGFQQKVDANGRLHPSWNQTKRPDDNRAGVEFGTRTTRLSCSNPNLQQLPRRSDSRQVRRLLTAPPGYKLWEFDYNQIELRLGAVYANEQSMLLAFKEGHDVHQLTAQRIGKDRYQGKTYNFAVIYGAGANRIADSLHIPYDEALDGLKRFHSEFPAFQVVSKRATHAAKHNGFVKMWTGRRRHFTDEKDYHKAFNSLIQGGAAEIVKNTMLSFYREPIYEIKLVAQVHDSLIFEIPEQDEQAIVSWIRNIMEWPKDYFPIPFPVDAKPWERAA